MAQALQPIDIAEDQLSRKGDLLAILLKDNTTKKNIIWATDSYVDKSKAFSPDAQIKSELITGYYGKLIQPRAAKSKTEQTRRTKDKAEVFTPLHIVDRMNKLADGDTKIDANSWQEYIMQTKLEITCGEAPFIVSRYDPVASSKKTLPLAKRVGFLDKKLAVVSRYCDDEASWLKWVESAYKSSYGYEWQGDNLLIARENLLYTLVDYYQDKFKKDLGLDVLKKFAEIISWNIFQMDGVRFVIPMSCTHETKIIPGELTLFCETPDTVEENECEGCKFNRHTKHNGKYVKIMDWDSCKKFIFYTLAQT